MRFKWPIILSVAWFVVVIGGAFLTMWYVVENGIGGRANINKRAEMMGMGAGLLASIGIGVIWFVWMILNRREINAWQEKKKLQRQRRRSSG